MHVELVIVSDWPAVSDKERSSADYADYADFLVEKVGAQPLAKRNRCNRRNLWIVVCASGSNARSGETRGSSPSCRA